MTGSTTTVSATGGSGPSASAGELLIAAEPPAANSDKIKNTRDLDGRRTTRDIR